MEHATQFIELTEKLLAHIEAQQETIQQLQAGLVAHSAALDDMLDWLRQGKEIPWREPATAPLEQKPPSQPAAAQGEERRGLPRRKGNPTSILVRHPGALATPCQGMVVDRSPEGLCLVLDQPIDLGATLEVCPLHHLLGPQWFQAEVRSCRQELRIWILGCRFLERLSWSELRLFG